MNVYRSKKEIGRRVYLKKLFVLFTCIIVLMITAVSVHAFINKNPIMIIGTEESEFDNPIYVINDRTYVPIRELCDKLGIPILWNSENRQITMDINNKKVPYDQTEANADLTNGVIPDADTAKSVAKTILESCMGKPVEYKEGDYEFYLTVDFSNEQNSWVVSQYAKHRGDFFGGGNVSPMIRLNKSTGEVIDINLESSWDKIIQVHQMKQE